MPERIRSIDSVVFFSMSLAELPVVVALLSASVQKGNCPYPYDPEETQPLQHNRRMARKPVLLS